MLEEEWEILSETWWVHVMELGSVERHWEALLLESWQACRHLEGRQASSLCWNQLEKQSEFLVLMV